MFRYVLRHRNPSKARNAGVSISVGDGGRLLSRVVAAKKNDITERAAKVLLLNIPFWYDFTYFSIVTDGSGAPDW